MPQALTLHPDSRCDAVTRLDVDIARPRPGVLALTYVVTGAVGGLHLPPRTGPERTDDLWKHTCFEVFLRPTPGEAYFEFNLSPSSQWATYRFNGYRSGMTAPNEAVAPRIDIQATAERFELHALLDLEPLPGFPNDAAWRLGVAAVIEEANGRKSHWALTHPPGKADFHHADGFAYEVQRAGAR